MDGRAYALKETYKENFAGGSVACGDGQTLNVGERLKAGDGYIVTDDAQEITALDGFDVLKPVAMTEVKEAAEARKSAARKSTSKSNQEG